MGILTEDKELDILDWGRNMVLKQMEVVLFKKGQWNYSSLTHYDWMLMSSTMLGGAENMFFEEHSLGMLRLLLEKQLHDSLCSIRDQEKGNGTCPFCHKKLSITSSSLKAFQCGGCWTFFDHDENHSSTHCYKYRTVGQTSNISDHGNCNICHWTTKPRQFSPLECSLVDGVCVARNTAEVQGQYIHVTQAESLKDPQHFGHLLYQYRNLVKLLEEPILGRTPKRMRTHAR